MTKAQTRHSQFGEDEICRTIFNRIGYTNRYAVEVGAADGRWLSNTLWFKENERFKRILIECDEKKAHKAIANFPDDHVVIDTASDLDKQLSKTPCPQAPDLMSIDIDSYDYWLWKDMTQYRPRVVVIEFNPYCNQVGFDPDRPVERDSGYQVTRGPIEELADAEKGYKLWGETFCNLIFVGYEWLNT